MSILTKLLEKKGIQSPEQLSEEEQKTFQQWQSVLGKDELTVQDIKDFCSRQVQVIEGHWADLRLEQERKAQMIPYHTVYKLLLGAIDSPKAAREALEKNLTQLLNENV